MDCGVPLLWREVLELRPRARPFLEFSSCNHNCVAVHVLISDLSLLSCICSTQQNMRLYQTARLKHACGGKTAVSAVKECNKTVGVGSGYSLGKLSCTGVSGPFHLPKVKANIWHGCKSLFYTTNSVCNTHRKHLVRGFSSKHAYEDAFAMARDKPEKFWSKAAQGISWFEHWTQTLDNTDTLFPKW